MTKIESKLKQVIDVNFQSAEDQKEFDSQCTFAKAYLEKHKWCQAVTELRFGAGIPGIFLVFLAKIKSNTDKVPDRLWVVCGDVPPAYLVTTILKNPYAAMLEYINLMEDWIWAIRKNGDIAKCYPVSAPATADYADMLLGRIEFMRAYLALNPDTPIALSKRIKENRIYEKIAMGSDT